MMELLVEVHLYACFSFDKVDVWSRRAILTIDNEDSPFL